MLNLDHEETASAAQIKEVGLADVNLSDQSASLVLHPQQLLMGAEITPETDEGVRYQPLTGCVRAALRINIPDQYSPTKNLLSLFFRDTMARTTVVM